MLDLNEPAVPELALLRRRLAILEEQRLHREQALYRAELKVWHYEDLLNRLFATMDLPFAPYDPAAERVASAPEQPLARPANA